MMIGDGVMKGSKKVRSICGRVLANMAAKTMYIRPASILIPNGGSCPALYRHCVTEYRDIIVIDEANLNGLRIGDCLVI